MNLHRSIVAVGILLCLGMACRRAAAGTNPIVYEYVTDQSSYSVPVGQTVTVKIYLRETLPTGTTSIISANGENGLLGAGFEVLSGTRPTNPSVISVVNANLTDFGGPSSVHLNNTHVSNPNEADVLETISDTATVGVGLANDNGAGANEVYLGSLTITGGSTVGTTNFSLGEYNVSGLSGGNTITNPDGYDLDVSSSSPAVYTGVGTTTSPFTVTTTAIPEPGSAALIGLCGAGALMRRRSRTV